MKQSCGTKREHRDQQTGSSNDVNKQVAWKLRGNSPGLRWDVKEFAGGAVSRSRFMSASLYQLVNSERPGMGIHCCVPQFSVWWGLWPVFHLAICYHDASKDTLDLVNLLPVPIKKVHSKQVFIISLCHEENSKWKKNSFPIPVFLKSLYFFLFSDLSI